MHISSICSVCFAKTDNRQTRQHTSPSADRSFKRMQTQSNVQLPGHTPEGS